MVYSPKPPPFSSSFLALGFWYGLQLQFSLTFVATDEQNASAIWSPTIRMCACEHDGKCVEPEEGDAENTDSKFVYLGCVCQGGYTGRFCDTDIDACELNGEPCYTGVKCIDLPAPANSSGYKCGPCPSGYTGNGAQCVDIDECQSDSPKKCDHKCVNTPASFFCDCNDGFKLKDDRRNCEDINECFPTSDCMQNCNNTVGSYNCSCREHFKTEAADWRNCEAENQCTSDPGCNHVCYEDDNGQAACACRANFELQSDGKTCKDIDECAKKLHRCSQTCANTEGSYKCSCAAGYELEKDGYGCQDINECLDDDSYECTVENQRCVNTRGSYKCDCVQDTHLIDGICRGLAEGEVPPKRPLPVPRNASEFQKQEAVQFSIQSGAEWDFERDKNFKIIMATVASDFCEKNRKRCALKDQRRKRRSPIDELYTAEEVNLLPGYPKNSSKSLQVAFYVLQPLGRYIGNISVLPRDILVTIMIANKSDIEKAIGANISGIEALFKPTTTTESPTAGPAEPADDSWKWIVIGVVTGVVVVIILIGLLIFCARKRKRGVKPITDPPHEEVAAKGYHRKPGANNENSLESGSN